ncbi:hypothetical protein ACFOEK_08425 [Litoribrevibacter euphylliae]|uniref:Uncharacterized protein n=1 Tax=Litoribrevibacter euphylliae TaxID=1834034 RepID=A0ABV7HB01_9GAMM
MNEYAPEYSKKERVMILLKHSVWAIPLFLWAQFWFLPWIKAFADQSHCYDYGVMTGTEALFYGLFVGMPLSLVLLVLLIEGPRTIKIIRLGQNPLPGEKVLKPTKYQYGTRAKLKPYGLMIILVLLVALSVRGIFWANDIIAMAEQADLPECEPTILLER